MSFKSFLPAAVWQNVHPFFSFFVYSVFPKVNGVDTINPPATSAIGKPTLRKIFDISKISVTGHCNQNAVRNIESSRVRTMTYAKRPAPIPHVGAGELGENSQWDREKRWTGR